MKFDHIKHDIEQFAYDVKEGGKMITISDDPILEHFKEPFLLKIESYFIKIL